MPATGSAIVGVCLLQPESAMKPRAAIRLRSRTDMKYAALDTVRCVCALRRVRMSRPVNKSGVASGFSRKDACGARMVHKATGSRILPPKGGSHTRFVHALQPPRIFWPPSLGSYRHQRIDPAGAAARHGGGDGNE